MYYWSYDQNKNATIYSPEGHEITWMRAGRFSAEMLDTIIAIINYERKRND